MTRTCLTALAALVVASSPATGQWTDPSDHPLLAGKTIVDAGTVRSASTLDHSAAPARRSPLDPPPAVRTIYFVQFRGAHVVCFFDDRKGKTAEVAALLLTESDARNLILATLDPSGGTVQVTLRPVQRMPCP